LGKKVRQWNQHKLVHIEKEIQNNRNQLQVEIEKWRVLQTQLTPMLGDMVTALPTLEIHDEILYLPSDFTKAHHDELWISHLEDVEIQLQEGEAQDALWDLRTTVRNINSLTFQKQVKIRGQDANTRANEVINQFKVKRHLLVMKYNGACDAIPKA